MFLRTTRDGFVASSPHQRPSASSTGRPAPARRSFRVSPRSRQEGTFQVVWFYIGRRNCSLPTPFLPFQYAPSVTCSGKFFLTTQSAYTPHPRPTGQTSFVFQWSIPNAIPLPPAEILKIWQAVRLYDFDTTHGAFMGMDVRDEKLKERLLESMKIQVRGEGWERHDILDETPR